MKLYTYFRSSAAYRVRIALNLKGIAYDPAFVHLRKKEQAAPEYLRLNPQGLVPALVDGPDVVTQSLAIIEYLEETHPEPPLLPKDPVGRARVRALTLAIACDIHPLNNLRVLHYLSGTLSLGQPQVDAWYRHWVVEGFHAIERMLAVSGDTGRFCHGETPTMADVCLVPQVANAERLDVDLAPFPTIRRITDTCRELPAFAKAAPKNQPDAEA
ncbi:MAG TPA: maleylacetoacetate isomerase [Alphaproteobacteria bacterium]|nr:maleylacetoacetate isomerase [Alphaproteobacteria bacterium]